MTNARDEGEAWGLFPSLLKQLEYEHTRQILELRRSNDKITLDLRRQLEHALSKATSTADPLDTTGAEGKVDSRASSRSNEDEERSSIVAVSLARESALQISADPCDPLEQNASMQSSTRESSSPSKPSPKADNMPSCYLQEQNSENQSHSSRPSQHVLYVYLSDKLKARMDMNSNTWLIQQGREILQRRQFARIVAHPRFETITVLMILLNAVLIAAVTQEEALNHGANTPRLYMVFNCILTGWFLLELLCRGMAVGPYQFFCSRTSWGWNWFDTCVVTSDAAQLFIETAVDGSSNSVITNTVLRMARVLRIVRVMRILKLIALLKEFRMMVMCILKSGVVLLYSALLMIMVMFLFGIYLTQNMTGYLQDGVGEVALLKRYFGSLERSLYTLFMTIAGGLNWETIADPLFDVDKGLFLIYLFYIFFMVFSVLNIITAVFVESVTVSAHNDHEEVIQAKLQEYEKSLQVLSDMFVEADTDGSRDISLEEFEAHLKNHKVVAHFSDMGITVDEARGIFELLDADADNKVTLDEFVFGCLRVKGQAKAVDLQTLMSENRKTVKIQSKCFAEILREVEHVKDLQERLELELHARRLGDLSRKSPREIIADIQPRFVDGLSL